MENTPKVVVEPPDRRGLRRISIGGETVGSAWSLRGLRRTLKRLGYPKHMDVHDRSSMCWRGGDSATWPDRTWRRRTTGALLIAGLLGSMVLLVLIGIPDAFGALTFAQKIAGWVFILSGALEGVAALAVLDFWGKRQSKYTGAVVLLGVLIALGTHSMLCFLWLQEREYTRYLFVYIPLWFWSAWALWLLVREKAWRGTPHPKKFAAGVAATALLATVNLAYSVVYEPSATPVLFKLTVRFGKPVLDRDGQVLHVPLTFHTRNIGKVPAYVINNDFSIYGISAKLSDDVTGELKARREAMVGEADSAELHTEAPEWETISAGVTADPGTHFEPGEEFSYEKIISLPAGAEYDSIEAHLTMQLMRKDRGKIDAEFSTPHYSWDKTEGQFWCPPKECGEFVTYRGRLRHNNNLVNVTRRPVYVNALWTVDADDSYTYTFLSSSPDFTRPEDPGKAEKESSRESERYGVLSLSAYSTVSFAALLNPPAE
ncbi:DUF308 domain-containing protein [Streptomyces coeruleoprunus]|uniref:DUF308 domain-containing protein n=1 Tax=Streptomyces coeruleoprunus TaxID=285563 RepID=A0ABV9X5U6_9ACTN